MKRFQVPAFLHGGDYNPDQWLHDPGILSEDLRLMKLANCNAMSLGIFAWTALEREEGCFDTQWLGERIDALYEEGLYTILATPSGSRPAWLAQKYPEVLRVDQNGIRQKYGERHNHCYTSPVYREKVGRINKLLAERFGSHPGVILWHISNEFGGDCYCPLCQDAFRVWLQKRYGDLDTLNRAWWNAFWSHTYTDWSQIEPPFSFGEGRNNGLSLDWKRFVSAQTTDFISAEVAAIRSGGSELPVTTNFMSFYEGLNYWELAKELDVVSWDSYPIWHGIGPITNPDCDWDEGGFDWRLASIVAFQHDLNRSFKGASFLLMESTPSTTNWQPVSKLKRPGMHALSSIQALAHGSDSVMYFQWRKSRGGFEKFHGAVVDHAGHEETRVFRETAELGGLMRRLSGAAGGKVDAEAALLYDWENLWALEGAAGPRNDGYKGYREDCLAHYRSLWKQAISMDMVERHSDFSRYKLVIAPMLYMADTKTAQSLEAFVRGGGTFVGTYWSGIVDETDLCHLGGFPGPLRKLLGLWVEELDALYPRERRRFTMEKNNKLGLDGSFILRHLWEHVHPEGAEVLAIFDEDMFAGSPALTVNGLGKGQAYYMASRNEEDFLDAFYTSLAYKLRLRKTWPTPIPEGCSVSSRRGSQGLYTFVMNFTDTAMELPLPPSLKDAELLHGMLDDSDGRSTLRFGPWGFGVLRCP